MSASSTTTLSPAAFHSLLNAVRSAIKPCPPPHAAPRRVPPPRRSDVCDAGQCRILLNEAQREIDRLRRQVDRLVLCAAPQPPLAHDETRSRAGEASADLTSPTRRRRAYAVDAIGDIRAMMRTTPTVEPQRIAGAPVFTNLGTRLDVLG